MANVIPVVFCFDKRIVLGASVAIKSLIDCAKDTTTYDIRILHSDLNLDTQKNLSELVKNTRHNIAFNYVNPDLFKNAPHSNGSWTEVVYYRLLVPEILNEYEKAIYSDVDVLFKDDLSELYNTDISDYELAAVRAEKNIPNTICHKYFEGNKKDYIYWSGLMLLNCKKFREENIFDKLIENAKKYYKDLRCFDLDLVNITCDKIFPLDLKYCVMQSIYYNDDYKQRSSYQYLKCAYSDNEIKTSKQNAVIVHYGGEPGKPWRLRNTYHDYQMYIDELPHKLRTYTCRDIRKKLFNKKEIPLLSINRNTKCLLVAPHPDDDTIGVGGLLIKYAKNFDVICIGSSGIALEKPYVSAEERSSMRIDEFNNVMESVGVKKHWIFETCGIPRFDNQMEAHFDEYCETLKDLKKYDYIFLPHPVDGHHEHRFITNKLFKRIVKNVGYNPNTQIVFYEVWADIQSPNIFFDISGEGNLFFDEKLKVLPTQKSTTQTSLLNQKIEISKKYETQWNYDDISNVPVIARQLKNPIERYRVLPIEKYLKLISFSIKYGIVGVFD